MGLPTPEATHLPRYLLDIKLEDPELRMRKCALGLAGMTLVKTLRRIRIESGSAIPSKGSGLIVIAPHSDFLDPPLTYYAISQVAGRIPRVVASDYVVDPNLPQDPEELRRTGKKPHPHWKRECISFVANIGHPISFDRSHPRMAIPEIDQTIASGLLLGVFLQETRKHPWEFNPPKTGAATIALRHPDLPVITLGLIGMEKLFGPIIARFANQSLTARQALEEAHLDITDKGALRAVHNRIVLATGSLLPLEIAQNLQARRS